MAIDYSRPGYKEMFANFGLAALAAQALEKTVLLLLAGIECLDASKVSKDDLHAILDKHDRKTLGQLMTALRQKVDFPKDLESDLYCALEKRNYVMHEFFLVKLDFIRLAESPEILNAELRPIRDLFVDVQGRIDLILEIVQKQIGVPGMILDQQAKQLFKRYKSIKQEPSI